MRPGRYNLSVKLLWLPAFFFFSSLRAQEPEDTVRVGIVEELKDSVPSYDDDGDEEIYYQDEMPYGKTSYFLKKSLQENGGMPGPVQVRRVPDSIVRQLRQDKDFWYVDHVFGKEKSKKEEVTKTVSEDSDSSTSTTRQSRGPSFFDNSAVKLLLWVITIGGFVAFLFIYLANSNVRLFRKKDRRIASQDTADVDSENIFEINYPREIEKAVNRGDYRLATRLMYLRLLKNLANKKIIAYQPARTNFDYLSDVRSTSYYEDFFRLTRNYEYAWYGHFDIDPGRFPEIRREFEKFENKLSQRE